MKNLAHAVGARSALPAVHQWLLTLVSTRVNQATIVRAYDGLDECGCSWKVDHLYNLHMQYQGKERQIPEPILIHTKHRHSVQRSSVQTSHIVRKAGDRECCA